jgi:hypothetical protein
MIFRQEKIKTCSLLSQYETRQKGTNEPTSEYDISVAFPFSAVTICKPQQK